MPHLKSAFKNLRKSRRRAAENRLIKGELNKLLKGPVTVKTLPNLYRAIDKAARRKIFAKNKAARLKGKLAKKVRTPRSAREPSPARGVMRRVKPAKYGETRN